MAATDFRIFVTADQAWPAFEAAVLSAEIEVLGGFRIFDLATKLHSAEAQAVGKDWFDLLLHVLAKGVSVTLIISDFDPVIATPLHETTWRTVRQCIALAELAEKLPGTLTVRAALHPACAGTGPRLALLPAVLKRRWDAIRTTPKMRQKRQAVGLGSGTIPELHPVTHHQKLAVIDGKLLYVGGLDLNERRYDTRDHNRAAAQTWSDVQVMMSGAVAGEARTHLLTFEAVTKGTQPAPELPLLKRTLSRPRKLQAPFLSPFTVLSEIEDAHLSAFKTARHLVYIETQFLRSSVITDALINARKTNAELSAVFILPALPEPLAFYDETGLDVRYGLSLQYDAVTALSEAFGDAVLFAAPVQKTLASRTNRKTLAGSPIVYVHNKVLMTDDDYGLVGSANLNGRSLRWDTEVAVEITDPSHTTQMRSALFDHWWQGNLPDEATRPATLQAWWREEVAKNTVRRPENRVGLLVQYEPANHADLHQSLPGVTEDIV